MKRALTYKDLTIEWFMNKCELDLTTGCWLWKGYKTKAGYGVFHVGTKAYRVHRLIYALHKEEIPDNLVIDHVYSRGCRYRSCCNLNHLEAVTSCENTRRGKRYKNSLYPEGFCVNGHEMTNENKYSRPSRSGYECKRCKWPSRYSSLHTTALD